MTPKMIPLVQLASLAVLSLALTGCLGDGPRELAAVSSMPLSNDVPEVTLVSTTADIEAAPRSTYSAIRVGPDGKVLMAELPGEGGILRIVDSTGHLLRSFGRQGEGPGEARGPSPLALSDSSVLAFDSRTLRLSEWDASGHILGMLSSDLPVIPLVAARDGRWIATGNSSSMAPLELDPRTLQARQLLPANDSFYQKLRPPAYDPHSKSPPTVGVWEQGFIVANGATYKLGLYDWNGRLQHVLSRTIEPNVPTVNSVNNMVEQVRRSPGVGGRLRSPGELARIAKTASAPRDYFSHVSPLGLDLRGRIWVAGPEGDSAYVDVFNTQKFLGRVHLPCRDFANQWAMSGNWIALVCAPDDQAFDGDAVVKLFKLEEKGMAVVAAR